MDVLCEIRNHVAHITLNRPAALNALSLGMITTLRPLLDGFAVDGEVHAVSIRGAGEKAFCAGGDIRALYESYRNFGSMPVDFFAAEYPLDHLLRFYPKPYLALIDGICLGGGMGLAQGSRLRIVGDRSRLGMPECAIGFFPDVGGSYFLSRLPGALGVYLALTGVQLRAADALYAGLADFYVPTARFAQLEQGLASLAWPSGSDARREAVASLVRGLAQDPGAAPLAALRPGIDQHFSAGSVLDIVASLEAESRPQFAAWAADTRKIIRARSPTMLAVTFEQIRRGRSMSHAACLRMEIGMAWQCFAQGDFLEGVRALIVDKDNAPKWRPDRLEEVAPSAVAAIFEDPWKNAVHPLATLEGE